MIGFGSNASPSAPSSSKAAHTKHHLPLETRPSLNESLEAPATPDLTAEQTTLAQSDSPTDPALSRTGNLRFGDYELIEEIARGGMGIIYKARQAGLNRHVALKVILTGPAWPEADVQRFQSEAAVAARLDHPHIVPVHDIGEQDGWHFYSMKLVDGPSLAQRMAEFNRDHRAGARLLVRVAKAVQHAHEQGVVHRDLKPGNILLDAKGEPYLTDFGLALSWEVPANYLSNHDGESSANPPTTKPGAGPDGDPIVGTPSYMAPEQATGKPGGQLPAVDIHSLGAILFQMLTGRAPYRGDSAMETLLKTVHNEPTRPSVLNPNVDPELEAICLICLRKQPGERYPSARAMADDLERWLDGQSTWAGRRMKQLAVAPARKLFRWRALAAAAVVPIAAALVLAWIMRDWVDNRPPTAALPGGSPAEESNAVTPPGDNPSKPVGVEAIADILQDAIEDCYSIPLEVRKLQADREGYARQIAQAKEELQKRKAGGAAKVLAGCRTHLRGWEWRYLQGVRESLDKQSSLIESYSICEEAQGFTAMPVVTDASKVVWANGDGEVCVWNLSTQKMALRTQAGLGAVWGVSLSPDGKRMAVAASDGLRVFDAADGESLHELKGHRGAVYLVAFSPDGQVVASAGPDRTVRLWNAATGKQLALCGPYKDVPRGIAFSPDSKRLGVAVESRLILLDGQSGSESERLDSPDGAIERFSFSPDGRWLATAVGGRIRVRIAKTLDAVQLIETKEERIRAMVFSPDSERLMVAVRDEVVVFDPRGPQPLLRLDGHGTAVSLGFHSAYEGLFAGIAGNAKAEVRLWLPQQPTK